MPKGLLTARKRLPRRALATALCAVLGASAARAGADAPVAQDAEQEAWLVVEVNHTAPTEPTVLLRLADGRLLARADDLARWRLQPGAAPAVGANGERYYALDAIDGLHYTVDEARQVLAIDAKPGLFPMTTVDAQPPAHRAPDPIGRGAFMNYDVSAQSGGGRRSAGALLEGGAFDAHGVATTDVLVRPDAPGAHVVRLDTTWTHDRPDALTSLRVGDAVSAPGSWGNALRFGGIQYATNFATQPGFVPFPLPQYRGEAATPSTIDLLVDDLTRLHRDVPPGPFTLTNLPVVSGAGTATVVVRDLLGRDQAVTLPYYVSPALLRPGLDAFSYEAGFVREDYGIASAHYGEFLASATRRHGFSDALTGEAHVELARDRQAAGVGATALVGALGTANGALAVSHSASGDGALALFGFQRQAAAFSLGANVRVASARYVELGVPPDQTVTRSVQAYASYATTRYGAFSLSASAQRRRDGEDVRLVSAGYNVSLGALGYLTISAARLVDPRPSTFYMINLTRPLSSDTSASVGVAREQDGNEATASVQRNVPAGDGYGYRVQAGAGANARGDAAFTLQTGVGRYSIEAARANGATDVLAEMNGSIVWFGGDRFFSRRVDDSFGVVRVPGYGGVRIYADNQEVARTNASGNALVPRLRAYESNPLRIEQADLPLDADIETLERSVVPALRSGVLATFAVQSTRGGTFTVHLEDGAALPAGARVALLGTNESGSVGADGSVFLGGLGASNRVRVEWRGQSCELLLLYPPSSEPLPQLGDYVCQGVKR